MYDTIYFMFSRNGCKIPNPITVEARSIYAHRIMGAIPKTLVEDGTRMVGRLTLENLEACEEEFTKCNAEYVSSFTKPPHDTLAFSEEELSKLQFGLKLVRELLSVGFDCSVEFV